MRMLLERYLTMSGYRALLAADGEEALRIAREQPKTALTMLDVVMPGLSGQEIG